MKGYVVVGGQYKPYYYGTFEGLRAAKIQATKCCEHWDNFSGLHFPRVYETADTELIMSEGRMIRLPVEGVCHYWAKVRHGNRFVWGEVHETTAGE